MLFAPVQTPSHDRMLDVRLTICTVAPDRRAASPNLRL
jgi:hypothetical protein